MENTFLTVGTSKYIYKINLFIYFSGPIQGEILPSVARCMGKEPKVNQVPLSA